MTKEEWRIFMKKKLNEMKVEQFEALCKKIQARLYEEQVWKKANTIGLTVSRNREIDTENIISYAWNVGKRVAVPKSCPGTSQLDFYVIDTFSQLEKGYVGLLEPNVTSSKRIEKDSIDLLIVPGLVFDKMGFRIGYGGGYYDRFLQAFANETLALTLESQLIERIPHDSYDIPVNRLVTEKRTLSFS